MSYFLTAFNANLRRASRVADLLASYIEAADHARAQGATIIDLREKPNAQPSYTLLPEVAQSIRDAGERVPRRVSPIHRDEDGNRLDDKGTFEMDQLALSKAPGIETTVSRDELRTVVASIFALTRQAKLVAWLERHRDVRADETGQRVLDAQRDLIGKLRALDPSMFDYAVRDFDKAHVADFGESADLDVLGFHWTISLKGDATETRYTKGREVAANDKRAMSHAAYLPASIDEDALAAE